MQVGAADQMAPVQVMQRPAHFSQSLIGIYAYNLRCLERLPWIQNPLKAFRVDAHDHPHRLILAFLAERQKIPGIYEMHCIHFSCILGRPRRQQGCERMLLMAGASTHRGGRMLSIGRRASCHVPLSGPGTCQREHFKGLIIHIHAGAQYPLDIQGFFAFIYEPHTSDDCIGIFKNTIA